VDVFIHVLGAIAVFVGYGTLLFAVAAMRRATRSEQVKAITSTLLATRRVGLERVSAIDVIVIAGVLMIAVTGLDMALTFQLLRAPWLDVAIGSFLVLAPLGPLLINPRLHRIADTADGEASGPISNALQASTRDTLLIAAMGGSMGILIGLVFVMTNKPALIMSLAAVVVCAGAGAALSSLLARRSDKR
jgi:uncharacterized MnhB-related membrane protein